MPESIRARIARFNGDQAAKTIAPPIEPQYCTRAEMESLRYEMQMRMDEAIKAITPRYSAVDMIEHACRPLLAQIDGLRDDNDNLRRALGRYAMSECGELPANDLTTYLKCQVWYSPWLTKDEQKIQEHLELPRVCGSGASPIARRDQRALVPAHPVLQDSEKTVHANPADHGRVRGSAG
jgi:hypothetical protein